MTDYNRPQCPQEDSKHCFYFTLLQMHSKKTKEKNSNACACLGRYMPFIQETHRTPRRRPQLLGWRISFILTCTQWVLFWSTRWLNRATTVFSDTCTRQKEGLCPKSLFYQLKPSIFNFKHQHETDVVILILELSIFSHAGSNKRTGFLAYLQLIGT